VPTEFLAIARAAGLDPRGETGAASFDPRVQRRGQVDILAVFPNEPALDKMGFRQRSDPGDFGVTALGLISRQGPDRS
jgi:hypothetical protein